MVVGCRLSGLGTRDSGLGTRDSGLGLCGSRQVWTYECRRLRLLLHSDGSGLCPRWRRLPSRSPLRGQMTHGGSRASDSLFPTPTPTTDTGFPAPTPTNDTGFASPAVADRVRSHRGLLPLSASPRDSAPTSNRQPTTSNQQPATSNQQPATSNQQPATSNQQPATNLTPARHPAIAASSAGSGACPAVWRGSRWHQPSRRQRGCGRRWRRRTR